MTKTQARWRLDRLIPIHVYEGDRPVATFHTAADARTAVAAVNAAFEAAELSDADVADFAQADAEARGDLIVVALGVNDVYENPTAEQIHAAVQNVAAMFPGHAVRVSVEATDAETEAAYQLADERAPGKSWREYRELARAARREGRPQPNPYHYFADRFADYGFNPPPDGSETYLDPGDIPSPLLLDPMTSEADIDHLTTLASSAADRVAMRQHRSPAEKTRDVVREALRMLVENGIITLTPREDWPEYVNLDPPYTQ